jgi:cell wall assembly regulator SMI1
LRDTSLKTSTPRKDSETSPVFDRHIQRQIASLEKRINGTTPDKAEIHEETLRLHAAQVAKSDHTSPYNILARLLKAARNQTAWKDVIANQNAQITEGVANVGRIKAEETRGNAEPTGVYAAAELARKKAQDGKDSKAAETALQKATAEMAKLQIMRRIKQR